MYIMPEIQHDVHQGRTVVPTETISVAEARGEFSNLLAQVEFLHRRFIIICCERPKAVLIS